MPRIARNCIKTSFFHIITQGINKSYIFDEEQDIKYYIKNMYKLTEDNEVKIIAYCIMNNHAHILVKCEKLKKLSAFMQKLNTRYGKYYNYKYNRVGYVFRDRYKSEGIYSTQHLINCINYIYNNPVKAKICKNPMDYPYSNCRKQMKRVVDSDYNFIDVDVDKNEMCKNIINNFLIENNLSFSELKNNRKLLKHLLIILKNDNNISLRSISQELGINRETIRRLFNC